MKINDHNAWNYAKHLKFLGISHIGFQKLTRLEKHCNNVALRLCNEADFDIPDDWSDRQIAKAIKTCPKLSGMKLFVNLDPRGYALKVNEPEPEMYRDFGGYGIVAPEF